MKNELCIILLLSLFISGCNKNWSSKVKHLSDLNTCLKLAEREYLDCLSKIKD